MKALNANVILVDGAIEEAAGCGGLSFRREPAHS